MRKSWGCCFRFQAFRPDMESEHIQKRHIEWIDLLKKAGQHYWQILPLGPTGYGDSPYQSFSSFGGNPYFIDLEELVREDLITKEQCESENFGEDPSAVDYEKIYQSRYPLLRKAYVRWKEKRNSAEDAEAVLDEETVWYCFYMAVKDHFHGEAGFTGMRISG